MTTSSAQDSSTESDALDVDALGAHLRAKGLTEAPGLQAELLSGGKSNLTYRITDGDQRWVLRRPPLGHVERGAHDVGREHRVMSALQGSDVPVPVTRTNCTDASVIGAPFYLMDEVDGVVLRRRDQVESLSVDERRGVRQELVSTMVALHAVDVAAVGLGGLGRPDGYLDRQLSRWGRQFTAVTARDTGVADRIVEALSTTMPSSPAPAIVHGDYRIDNVIVGPERPPLIAAVLDWEMATIGDPLADLGMLAMFWDEPDRPFNPITAGLTAFEGFGSVDDLVQDYAHLSGTEVDRISWYLCFSQFKLAVILEQIDVRHASGQTLGDGFDGLTAMVDQLLVDSDVAAARLG